MRTWTLSSLRETEIRTVITRPLFGVSGGARCLDAVSSPLGNENLSCIRRIDGAVIHPEHASPHAGEDPPRDH